MVVVLAMCVAGLSAVGAQIRCIDAAREAARLAARGDESATTVARKIAPQGAVVELRWDGDLAVARVSSTSPMLFGVTVAARAVAAAESGVR
ncbi:hypothetical protein MLIT_47700 [Mycolicibacterium litorale]|uniref:Pilus biosynthesis protein TadE n=2 Tax=Mycolicibacterium litorale TaxID=758802 RepID=A0AAD1IQY2_9MYCO|nr:hypothetical protein BCL50_2998 [Mycolicibacterium litorale]BBY19178.1 hypothetical protein MLIT_47700 [Mycolicibacterium litorale]